MASGAVGIVLEVDGLMETRNFYEGYPVDVSDFRPFFIATQQTLRKIFLAQFGGEGVGKSGKWQKLSKKYKKFKSRARPGRKILVFDGTLRGAMTDHKSPHALRIITRDQMAYGTAGLEYASVHQYGSRSVPIIPKRPIIDLKRKETELEMDKNLREHARKVAVQQRRRTGAPVEIR